TSAGVSATASSPSSTLSRVTSKRLPAVRKFGAIAANTAHSTASAASSLPMGPHGSQDDRSLDRALPVRADAQKCQRRTDCAEQPDAEHGAGERRAAAGHRGSADDNRGDDRHFETDAAVARNLVEARGIHEGCDTSQRAANDKSPVLDTGYVQA